LNIPAIVEDIQLMGGRILQPIGINKQNILLYGLRRLKGAEALGWTQIPVTIHDVDDPNDMFLIEHCENNARKSFTTSERVAILEEIERRRIGHRPGKGANLDPFQQQMKGKKSRVIVGKFTDVSPAQLAKEKQLVEMIRRNPSDAKIETRPMSDNYITPTQILDKVDKGKMKIDKALHRMEQLEYQLEVKKHAEERRIEAESKPSYQIDTIARREKDLKNALDNRVNEVEYESQDKNVRLILGEFSDVSEMYERVDQYIHHNNYYSTDPFATILRHGIPDNSVDLIFTNPGYSIDLRPDESNHYSRTSCPWLSDYTQRVLKPGGSLVIPALHDLIPETIGQVKCDWNSRNSSILKFIWPIIFIDNNYNNNESLQDGAWSPYHSYKPRINDSFRINVSYQPFLWFIKEGEREEKEEVYKFVLRDVKDVVFSIDDIIKQFTSEGQTVLDPLMCEGDIGVSALKLGRKFIGIEGIEEFYEIAKEKIIPTKKQLETRM